MTQMNVPHADLTRVSSAHVRLLAFLDRLTDQDVSRSSLIPDWTIGHVLTHIARNADSHRRRAEAAARQEAIEQYRDGYAGRAAEIDVGARRSASELQIDIRSTADSLESTWRNLPDDAWTSTVKTVAGLELPLARLPARRWQEIEVHLVDLGIGPTHRDWSDDFVEQRLPSLRATLPGRLPDGLAPPNRERLDEREELAWLYGRFQPNGFPVLAPWA